ncbi:MAG: 4-(cytidine 5'-diphospho)-2-C-methyl-D-erythritol kinase, partial [Clostridium sp.]|nr:4-(cytidine 5'-diphospho)-2-C-methyl-D-erythritol kinase [Clostridium sp.]
IKGGTALCEGIGEKITPLKPFKNHIVLLIKPPFGVSTKDVYKAFDINKVMIHPNTEKLVQKIEENDLYYIANNMKNLLENVTIRKHKVLYKIKENLVANGAVGAMMSGSGPTIFALFDDMQIARRCYDDLKEKYVDVFLTRTI